MEENIHLNQQNVLLYASQSSLFLVPNIFIIFAPTYMKH